MKEAINILRKALGEPRPQGVRHHDYHMQVAEQEHQLLNQPEHEHWKTLPIGHNHPYSDPGQHTVDYQDTDFPTLENKVKAIEVTDHGYGSKHIIHRNPKFDPNFKPDLNKIDALGRGQTDNYLSPAFPWRSTEVNPVAGKVRSQSHHLDLKEAVSSIRRMGYGSTAAISKIHYHPE